MPLTVKQREQLASLRALERDPERLDRIQKGVEKIAIACLTCIKSGRFSSIEEACRFLEEHAGHDTREYQVQS